VRVVGVGLAALPVSKTLAQAASFGGTSSTPLAIGEQPLGDRPAHALSALDRPHLGHNRRESPNRSGKLGSRL
jgi:hypothetical protein